MIDPPVPTTTAREVARIEWDRGHDEFDAIVYLDGAEGIVVARTHDYWPQAGYTWIRRSEVLSLESLAPDSATVRVLDELGVRKFALDPALLDLREILRRALGGASPIALYSRETGSDELLVGLVVHVGDTGCTLADVDPGGVMDGEELTFELDDVIAAEWSTDYLNALEILMAGPDPSP